MNPLGIHASVFVGDWSAGSARHAIESAKAAGYDLIEIPALDPAQIDVRLTRQLLADHGLAATCSMGLAEGADVLSDDPVSVAAGRRLLSNAVEVVAEIGGTHLVGVLYSQLKKNMAPCTPASRQNALEAMQFLEGKARELGIEVALEVVNRYETNLVNTIDDMALFLDETGTDLGIHADTYHMNIEERSFSAPWKTQQNRISYVHIGESHRGYLGTGTVDFNEFFAALKSASYDGIVTFESFSSAVVDQNLSNTLGVWRNLWDDPADLALEAREVMARHLA